MTTAERLEELRAEIQAERISYSELAELQELAPHIDPDDVELLQWAGIPEFTDDELDEAYQRVMAADEIVSRVNREAFRKGVAPNS